MRIVLVAAVSENGVIGRGGMIPWHLPDDLKRFKRMTVGHTVIMGRRTFESLGRPLPDRTNVVLTGRADFAADGVLVARDLDEALARATGPEAFVIGGEAVYREALPRADRLELTVVHATVEGDARFPDLDESAWDLVAEAPHPADARHEHAFTFRTYRKKPAR